MINLRVTEKQISEIKKGNLAQFAQDILRAVLVYDKDREFTVTQLSARDGSQHLLIERPDCQKSES